MELIGKQIAIETILGQPPELHYPSWYAAQIEKLPPAQPERIKARWLPIGMADAVGGESAMWGDEIAYHACDNCWQQALEKDGEEVLSDFCPHCGADMRGEDK